MPAGAIGPVKCLFFLTVFYRMERKAGAVVWQLSKAGLAEAGFRLRQHHPLGTTGYKISKESAAIPFNFNG